MMIVQVCSPFDLQSTSFQLLTSALDHYFPFTWTSRSLNAACKTGNSCTSSLVNLLEMGAGGSKILELLAVCEVLRRWHNSSDHPLHGFVLLREHGESTTHLYSLRDLRETTKVQASVSSSAREDVKAQIDAWHRNGFDDHIDPELMNVYQLLAGNPGPIVKALKLEWIPAFALQFW